MTPTTAYAAADCEPHSAALDRSLPFRAFRVIRAFGEDAGIRRGILHLTPEGIRCDGKGVLPWRIRVAAAIGLGAIGCVGGLVVYYSVLDWWVLQKDHRRIAWSEVQSVWVDEDDGTLYLAYCPRERDWITLVQGFKVDRALLEAATPLLEEVAGDKLTYAKLPKQRPFLIIFVAMALATGLAFGADLLR